MGDPLSSGAKYSLLNRYDCIWSGQTTMAFRCGTVAARRIRWTIMEMDLPVPRPLRRTRFSGMCALYTGSNGRQAALDSGLPSNEKNPGTYGANDLTCGGIFRRRSFRVITV